VEERAKEGRAVGEDREMLGPREKELEDGNPLLTLLVAKLA